MGTTLVIDTSKNFILIGLIIEEKFTFKKIYVERDFSVYLMNSIIKILDENHVDKNKIDRIICGRGPGAFTGLRLSLAVAKTLAYQLKIKLYSISSLVLYTMFVNANCVTNLDDARSEKLYYAIVEKDRGYVDENIIDKSNLNSILNKNCQIISSVDLDISDVVLQESLAYFDLENYSKYIKEEDVFLFVPTYLKKLSY